MEKSTAKKWLVSIKEYFVRNAGILIGLLILCVIISVSSPVFLTSKNIMNVLRQISSNAYIALGMMVVIIMGGIDLSVGSSIAVTGIIAASLLKTGTPVVVAVIVPLLCGAAFGAINGIIITRTTLPPFIVTLSTMNILRGVAYVYTHGATVRIDNYSFISLGTGYLWIIPLPVIYLFVLVFLVWIFLSKTTFGRHVYAIGSNERAAAFCGIDVKNLRMYSYVFSGLMAAVAGLTLATRSYSGEPTAGNGAEMDAIAACVLGGTSFMGGYGYAGGMIIGAIILGVLNNGLNLMGIDSFWQVILKGVVILLAVYIDYIKKTRKKS